MRVPDLFPKENLKAEDLGDKTPTLTISRVTIEDLYIPDSNTSERKPVVWFQEMEQRHAKDPNKINKRLPINATNAYAIADQHGVETDDWAGKRITLCATTCRLGRDVVPCIRVTNDKGQIYDVKKRRWVKRP